MFVIRKKQIGAFKNSALLRFEDDMVDHVKKYFPNHYEVMKEDNVRSMIRYGYSKAKKYGFISVRNVCQYLNIMLLLGSDFDVDPQYPWVIAILNDNNLKNPNYKIDQIIKKEGELLEQINGPKNIYIYRVILNFTRNTDEIYTRLKSSHLNNIFSEFNYVFRQKYQFIGEINLRQLVNQGIIKANTYGIKSEYNVVIYLVFSFVLGSGFDTDFQFSWAAETLNNKELNENEKIELLFNTTIINLKSILNGLF